jgi:hypothetical protein
VIRQTPIQNTVFVPTPEMFKGDFSVFASPACQNGRVIAPLRAPFVENKVDPARFSPTALKIASRLPKALDACGRYLTGNILHENDHQIPARVDYQLSSKHTLFGRYMLTKIQVALPFELDSSDVLTAGAFGSNDQSHSLTIGSTYIVSPNVVNSFRLSGNRVRALKPGASMFGPNEWASMHIPTNRSTSRYRSMAPSLWEAAISRKILSHTRQLMV